MTSSLVSLGGGRAPESVLAALREIDADADLVHLGGHEWLLGVKQPNPSAREKVEEQLKQVARASHTIGGGLDPADKAQLQSDLGKEFQLLQYCAQGFRPIQLYVVDGDPWTFGKVVESFRLRDFNWRTRREAAVQELKDAISFDVQDQKRTALVREYFDQEGGSLWHKVMRRARSFLTPRAAALSP